MHPLHHCSSSIVLEGVNNDEQQGPIWARLFPVYDQTQSDTFSTTANSELTNLTPPSASLTICPNHISSPIVGCRLLSHYRCLVPMKQISFRSNESTSTSRWSIHVGGFDGLKGAYIPDTHLDLYFNVLGYRALL